MGLEQTYKGKTVLVTGHTGFKGGWLSLWLHSLGAHVVGYSTAIDTKPSLYDAIGTANFTVDYRSNIKTEVEVSTVVEHYRPDFIFHLAAQPLVRQSYDNPVDTFKTNVNGTINVLEAIRKTDHPTTAIFITSDKCYDNKEWEYAYRENDKLGGHDPYSASKAMAEIAIESYRKSYFSGTDAIHLIASARAGNVIGGGDWANERIIPDCVRSIIQKKTLNIRNYRATRPWQSIFDVLFGYLLLGASIDVYRKNEPQKYTSAWNFGPNPENCISVIELTGWFKHYYGAGVYEDCRDSKDKHEAQFLQLDCTKARTELRWAPKYDIHKTLQTTAAWYKQYYESDGKRMKQFSLDQIEEWRNL